MKTESLLPVMQIILSLRKRKPAPITSHLFVLHSSILVLTGKTKDFESSIYVCQSRMLVKITSKITYIVNILSRFIFILSACWTPFTNFGSHLYKVKASQTLFPSRQKIQTTSSPDSKMIFLKRRVYLPNLLFVRPLE